MKRLLLVFLFTTPAFGASLGKNDKLEALDDFSGGLNTQSAPHKINKNQSPNLQNVLVDEKPGTIVTRKGFVQAGSTPTLSKITFMGEYVPDNGLREMLVSDSSRILKTSDFQNFTLLKTTLTTSALLRMAQGRGKAMICNGTDPCMYYDGTVCRFLDGNNGTPNVPRGKFPVFYQDRFWVGNSTSSNSTVYFSALTSTDGFILDPLTDPRAWPVLNQINIGAGDGRPISGMDVLKGQLQVHKDRGSIYTIYGTDEFTYFARRTNAHSGTVSNDSLAQGDNLEYYLAKDGVYAFDGGDSVRISDQIQPDIDAIVSNLANIVSDVWDTQAEFAVVGSSFSNTTTTANGFVTVLSTCINIPGPLPLSQSSGYEFQSISSSFTHFIAVPPLGLSNNFQSGYLDHMQFFYRVGNPTVIATDTLRFTAWNVRTGEKVLATSDIKSPNGANGNGGIGGYEPTGQVGAEVHWNPKLDVTRSDILAGNLMIKIEFDTNTLVGGSVVEISSFTRTTDSSIFIYSSTGSYTSEVATISANITFWDTFASALQTNGGSVNLYIKGSNAPVFITSEPYTGITPGSVIPLPTSKNYVQYTASFTSVSTVAVPNIDNVIINHNEGGLSETRPIGINWLNRYWLVVATQSGSNSVVYVKSKITNQVPNAWTKFAGINLRSISKFGDNLYGGAVSTGVIYRMDYGTNDNGSPIEFVYETPELDMGERFFDKDQTEYLIDIDKMSSANLTIGTAINNGSFRNTTVSIDGSGRLLKSVKINPVNAIPKSGRFFRYRFYNADLDKSIRLHTFGVIYQPTQVRN